MTWRERLHIFMLEMRLRSVARGIERRAMHDSMARVDAQLDAELADHLADREPCPWSFDHPQSYCGLRHGERETRRPRRCAE